MCDTSLCVIAYDWVDECQKRLQFFGRIRFRLLRLELVAIGDGYETLVLWLEQQRSRLAGTHGRHHFIPTAVYPT